VATGRTWGIIAILGIVVGASLAALRPGGPQAVAQRERPLPAFRHVVVVMMENQSAAALLSNPAAPYIRKLAKEWAVDTDYYGVTHVSLPNYVAAIAGTTGGTHSDNPAQRFTMPTLADQLDARHISWQAAMGGLPYAGYTGDWFPAAPNSTGEPPDALYAKKHDPFMLFPRLVARDRRHILPLARVLGEIRHGALPAFLWVTPNLCQDMHGQPNAARASCPEDRPARLVRDGNAFLARFIPEALHALRRAGGPFVIFVTWDEAAGPTSWTPGAVGAYLAAGPAAPPLLPFWPNGPKFGGGRVLLLVLTNAGPRPLRVSLWADHYSLLKTIEAAWHLPFLGAAKSPTVPVLAPFFFAPGPPSG
jgi:hypothetical protein